MLLDTKFNGGNISEEQYSEEIYGDDIYGDDIDINNINE